MEDGTRARERPRSPPPPGRDPGVFGTLGALAVTDVRRRADSTKQFGLLNITGTGYPP